MAVERVLEKWTLKKYAPQSLVKFLDSELIKRMEIQNEFEKRCVIGYVLSKKVDLNYGQQQRIIADYLRYIYEKSGGIINGRSNINSSSGSESN